jgi:hypothetical protein
MIYNYIGNIGSIYCPEKKNVFNFIKLLNLIEKYIIIYIISSKSFSIITSSLFSSSN